MKKPMDENPGRTEEESAGPTLEVNPDDVCRLIQIAQEFHAQDAVVLPDEPEMPPEDLASSALATYATDPILEEFRSVVTDLDRSQQVEVVALMWMGRGDYSPEEWKTVLQEASNEWTSYTADYLLAHPMVADHLSEGLEMLGYSCD